MSAINWDNYPNFSEWEFACRGTECNCGGLALMDPDFMERLQTLRSMLGFSLFPSSGYRCEKHNKKVKGGPAHPTGKAVDLIIAFSRAWEIVSAARAFTGIGVKQKGPYDKRFIHLDTLQKDEFVFLTRPTIWSY